MAKTTYNDRPAAEKPDIDDLIYGSAEPIPSER